MPESAAGNRRFALKSVGSTADDVDMESNPSGAAPSPPPPASLPPDIAAMLPDSGTRRASNPPPPAPAERPAVPTTAGTDRVGDRTPEPSAPGRPATVPPEIRVSMLPWRLLATAGLVTAFALTGWQLARVFAGQERIGLLSWGALLAAVVGVAGILVWTWSVVENARRLLARATTQDPPSPLAVTAAWAAPIVVAAGAVGFVTYLQRRLVLPEDDTSTALPLTVAVGAGLATLVLAIRPLGAISSTLRRLGGAALPVGRLIWVPLALAAVGAGSLYAMRSGGLFGEQFDGVAPGWALGVVLVAPVVVMMSAMWRGAVAAEDTVHIAFDRRNGALANGIRSRRSLSGRLLRAEALPRVPRADDKPIRLAPGADVLRLSMFIALAALCLVAIVGAIVMILFWRESRDGLLVPAQEQRAWEVLGNLQILQRWLALGLLAVTTGWAFVSVLNARLATGRRRNPVLAAIAWPASAYGIWWIADRIVDASAPAVVAGFVAQALVFAVPFFLLERAAIAVHAHRAPLRLTYCLGVVLLVQNQGLFGLSTIEYSSEQNDFGRLAGSLAVAALLQLVASMSVSESSRVIADAAADLAADHNALVAQRPVGPAREQITMPAPAGSVAEAGVVVSASSTPPPPAP